MKRAKMIAAASTAPKTVMPSIQWLRAIAAMMVILHHANYHTNALRQHLGEAATELLGFSSWWFGIHIFFLVSGFIMIHVTRNFGEPGAWRQFLARRLVRVIPLYWLVTTITVIGLILAPQSFDITTDKVSYVLKSYAFIPVLRSAGDPRPIVGQGWTLNYEMFFYAAFALATLAPRRVGVGAISALFVVLVFLGRNLDFSTPIPFTWTDGLLLEFLFGVYIGLAFEKGRRLPAWAGALSIAAGTILVILNFQGPTFITSGIPAALIVCGLVLGPSLRETAATRWLTHLGDASYSLYLTHTFVLRPFEKWWQSVIGDHAPPWIFLVTATLIAVAVGLLTYRLLERPMTRYLQNRLAARSGRSLNAVLGRAALAMPRLSWQRLNAPHYPPQLPPSV